MVDPISARVLVIEDNIYNYTLIARLLKFLGVEHVEWSRTGRQLVADQVADSLSDVDLVLLDIHLPHEDGYLTLERLRASDHMSGTRVVAVTAEATEGNMRRAREAGFDGFIAKPIDPDRFPDQVKAALRGEQVWDLGGALAVSV
ncbi:MAG: response regulator [Anaerolineae bacterium]|jgi:two-component system cell cycle response regulator DivK